jgi:hypothetical protein
MPNGLPDRSRWASPEQHAGRHACAMTTERRSPASRRAEVPDATAPDPAPSPYGSVVGALERAELAARERRLVAETEAEGIRARAAATVAELDAAVPARIAKALAESRARSQEAADAEIGTIEARLADDRPEAAPSVKIASAAELLVAAVLGETLE